MLRPIWGALPRAFAVLLTLLTTVIAGALPATASSSGDMLSYTNSSRSSHGLGRLSTASDLTRLAQQHAAYMASHHSLEHTSNLGGKVCCWRAVGENVGYGPNASAVFNAFMHSSSHRANILSGRYTQIGIGTARSSDGTLWVDQIFRQPTNGGSSTSTSPTRRTGVTHPVAMHRASRSTARTPLRVPTHRATAATVQPRGVLLSLRMGKLRALRGDPVQRSMSWLHAMGYLTAP